MVGADETRQPNAHSRGRWLALGILAAAALVAWVAVSMSPAEKAVVDDARQLDTGTPEPTLTPSTQSSSTGARDTQCSSSAASTLIEDAAPGVAPGASPTGDNHAFPPGGDLEVRVVSERGLPVANAGMIFYAGDGEFLVGRIREGETGVLVGLPSASGRLDVMARGYIPQRRWITGCAQGTRREEVFVLVKGHAIEGRVFDETTGAPVADAYVESTPAESPEIIDSCATDGQGRFRAVVDPGASRVTRVSVGHDGYLRETRLVKLDPLEPGPFAPLEIRLSRGVKLRGRVVGPGGAAVGGARVRVAGDFGDRATCDPKGRFEIVIARWPPREGPITLLGYDEGAGCGMCVLEPRDGELPSARIRLEGTGSVAGSVSREGRSIENVASMRVRLRPRAGLSGIGSDRGLVQIVLPRFATEDLAATPSPDGTFLIPNVPLGLYDLSVFDGKALRRRSEAVRVGPGGPTNVEIDLTDEGSAIVGIVVDGAGRPIAGVDVRATAANLVSTSGYEILTNTEGRFRLSGWLEPTALDVHVRAEGYAAQRLAGIRPGPRPLRVVLSEMASVEGRLTVDGEKYVGVVVIWLGQDVNSEPDPRAKSNRWTLHTTNGSFRVRGIPAGRHVLHARNLGGTRVARPVEIEAEDGKTVGPLDVRLLPVRDEDR